MEKLSTQFWENRYNENKTGWDLKEVSPPLKEYFDQLTDKSISILIPGCGNGYEGEYLFHLGFNNVHLLDLVQQPLDNLLKRVEGFPRHNLHVEDFFEHQGKYDLIIEQTLFCAIDPILRLKYIQKIYDLLAPNGKMIGLLFNREFEGGPPFGGNKVDYLKQFETVFKHVQMEECYNSILPRKGTELFIQVKK